MAPAGGNADSPSSSPGSSWKRQWVLTPGDWVRIDYDGRTVIGMIERFEEGVYRFAYWKGGVLRFGTVKPDQIGPWDEQLTIEFRAAIAIDPHYVEKFIAWWKEPRSAPPPVRHAPTKAEPRHVQKRLFPEE